MALAWPSEADANHQEETTPTFSTSAACLSKEVPIRIIELSHDSDRVAEAFWAQAVRDGDCKDFPERLWFWFDKVVAQLLWSDGDLMYVLRGHDSGGVDVYTWMIASQAKDRGIPEPGIEVSPAPVGLHI